MKEPLALAQAARMIRREAIRKRRQKGKVVMIGRALVWLTFLAGLFVALYVAAHWAVRPAAKGELHATTMHG